MSQAEPGSLEKKEKSISKNHRYYEIVGRFLGISHLTP